MNTFAAPWGRALKLITTIFTLLLLGIPSFVLYQNPNFEAIYIMVVAGIPLAILLGAMLFIIRCYEIENNTIIVHRLIWDTKIDLSSLSTAEIVPNAMSGSIRTFGNGGLFSFSGRFRNKSLGAYRALVTDLKKTVVLRLPGQTLVLSPDEPERFVDLCLNRN